MWLLVEVVVEELEQELVLLAAAELAGLEQEPFSLLLVVSLMRLLLALVGRQLPGQGVVTAAILCLVRLHLMVAVAALREETQT